MTTIPDSIDKYESDHKPCRVRQRLLENRVRELEFEVRILRNAKTERDARYIVASKHPHFRRAFAWALGFLKG